MGKARSGREVYHGLCEAKDLRKAVRKLKAEDLTTVAEFLACVPGTIPGMVWDVVKAALGDLTKGQEA